MSESAAIEAAVITTAPREDPAQVFPADVDNSGMFTGQAISVHRAQREPSCGESRRSNRRTGLDDGAVGRARRAIDGYGSLVCSACRRIFPPSRIDVDHRVALADGGMDCDANVLLICKECHAEMGPSEPHGR